MTTLIWIRRPTLANRLSTADTTRILIADHLGFDAVTDDQNLVADLALDRVDLAVTLEREFDIKIDDAALEGWQAVGDVVKSVVEKLRARDQPPAAG